MSPVLSRLRQTFSAACAVRGAAALMLAALPVCSVLRVPVHAITVADARHQERNARAASSQTLTPSSQQQQDQRQPSRETTVEEQDDDVERISTDLTNILLTVTDRKRQFITDLRAEDIRVLEDGVQQEVIAFGRETDAPLSIAVLIDASASQQHVLADEQRAALDFVRSVLRPDRDTAAVISFTGLTRVEQPPTSDLAAFEDAVGRVRVTHTPDTPACHDPDAPDEEKRRCYTAVWDAIAITAREVLARTPETTRRAVILLSDGDDTGSRLVIYQAAEQAVRHNVAVYSIGIRDKNFKLGELRRDLLRRISEDTGGRAFFPKRPEELAAAFAQIESELRSQYLISYRTSNRARDGSFRRLQIEVVNPRLRKQRLRLLYRQGYYAEAATDARRKPEPEIRIERGNEASAPPQ